VRPAAPKVGLCLCSCDVVADTLRYANSLRIIVSLHTRAPAGVLLYSFPPPSHKHIQIMLDQHIPTTVCGHQLRCAYVVLEVGLSLYVRSAVIKGRMSYCRRGSCSFGRTPLT
jgi:hypothetical protein